MAWPVSHSPALPRFSLSFFCLSPFTPFSLPPNPPLLLLRVSHQNFTFASLRKLKKIVPLPPPNRSAYPSYPSSSPSRLMRIRMALFCLEFFSFFISSSPLLGKIHTWSCVTTPPSVFFDLDRYFFFFLSLHLGIPISPMAGSLSGFLIVATTFLHLCFLFLHTLPGLRSFRTTMLLATPNARPRSALRDWLCRFFSYSYSLNCHNAVFFIALVGHYGHCSLFLYSSAFRIFSQRYEAPPLTSFRCSLIHCSLSLNTFAWSFWYRFS